ncbi:MAG: hypothetical protein ABI723_00095 [Bacteroidia bacterium]
MVASIIKQYFEILGWCFIAIFLLGVITYYSEAIKLKTPTIENKREILERVSVGCFKLQKSVLIGFVICCAISVAYALLFKG